MYDNFINCFKRAASKENMAAIIEDLKIVSRVSFIGSLAYLFFEGDVAISKLYTAIVFAFNMICWTTMATCVNSGGGKKC